MKHIIRDRKTLYFILSIVLVSVFTLTVAYAALNTVLTITGNAEVTAASWDIHFDNIKVNQGSIEATKTPAIVESNTINFVIGLKEPGNYYKFTVDIVNDGTIDAMIDSIVKTPSLTVEQSKYLKYEIEYTDGNTITEKQLLPKDTKKTISILVAYRSDVATSNIPAEGESLNLSFIVNYVQADETSTIIPESTPLVRVVSGDLNTAGSEICINEECFYLIKNNGKSITMLAKYNLHVGNSLDSSDNLTPLENPTGIQDENAIGAVFNSSAQPINYPWTGIILFSKQNYWWNETTYNFKQNYNSFRPNSGTIYAYDQNSEIYQYVESYKSFLQNMGVTVFEARLISYEELNDLGCVIGSCGGAPKWVRSTSYWTGSVSSNVYVWNVNTFGNFGDIVYNSLGCGVRPVIEISLSEL